ncbi:component of SufBCD complex [Ruegeria sediminis]|uniref:Component of SufBCD complex n=1 Tax=Ruegeria sediminis TaxID=2583820 RepID=A0ABY2X073_9RHOB|nr:component of SufBCD complex [Ruegeria sediminis]TMV08636.1 component of SufBCD complex [Ruegeria sediminis]
MDWYTSIFELIDLRSFSNLWFWIAVAVLWSSASHWVLGVPYDMIQRARRVGGQAEADLLDIVRIHVNRVLYIIEVSGVWLLAIVCFLLSMLAMLGFYYSIEFAQAVFLMAFPMSLVALLNLSFARRIRRQEPKLEIVAKLLLRCRLYVQLIGIVSIFVTSLWGMYQNLSIGVLG